MRRTRHRSGERGFTMMEAVILLSITVLFVTTMVSAQGRDLLFVRETAREAAARRACAARLEALLADRSAVEAGERALGMTGPPGSLLETAEGAERVREVEPGLFEVEVRVSWSAAGGERRSVRLTTLLHREGAR